MLNPIPLVVADKPLSVNRIVELVKVPLTVSRNQFLAPIEENVPSYVLAPVDNTVTRMTGVELVVGFTISKGR